MTTYDFTATWKDVWETGAGEPDYDDADNGIRECLARWGYQVGLIEGLHYNTTTGNWTGRVPCSVKFPFRAGYGGWSVKLSR